MAAKTVDLTIKLTFSINEDRLRDIFEEQEIKFSKKKLQEVIDDFEGGLDQSELEELFEEQFTAFLAEYYGE